MASPLCAVVPFTNTCDPETSSIPTRLGGLDGTPWPCGKPPPSGCPPDPTGPQAAAKNDKSSTGAQNFGLILLASTYFWAAGPKRSPTRFTSAHLISSLGIQRRRLPRASQTTNSV